MPLQTIPTAKQRRIYDTFLRLYETGGGVAPTIRELAVATGSSSLGTTHHHLHKLVDAGILEYREGRTPAFVPVRHPNHELAIERVLAYCRTAPFEQWSRDIQEIVQGILVPK